MSIALKSGSARRGIAWLRDRVPEDAKPIFEDRGYSVSTRSGEDLEKPEVISGLAAVVFTQQSKKPGQICRDLERYGPRLLDYGCVIILFWEQIGFETLANAIDQLELPVVGLARPGSTGVSSRSASNPDLVPPPYVVAFPSQSTQQNSVGSWHSVANKIAEFPPAKAPNGALDINYASCDKTVDTEELRLDGESEVLVRRAFGDSKYVSVNLTRLSGGLSGADVFKVYAEVQGALGGWPQPHFMKIGTRPQIVDEYQNYDEWVDPYVPFHLGPHLDCDLCCVGAKKGILVGDYVDGSEGLHLSAGSGRSASAIACLFDKTLASWYGLAEPDPGPIANLLKFPVDSEICADRITKAFGLGATLLLPELRALFFSGTDAKVLVGRIHGDLRAANVLVRATDAIVIDFPQQRREPLLFDAACLEASLLIEGFEKDTRTTGAWLSSLRELYEVPVLECSEVVPKPTNCSLWFYTAVLQIRRYARQWQCSPNQYATALAAALLQKASRDADAQGLEGERRAAAYFLAELVLTKAFTSGAAPEKAAAGGR